jgi:hypothetical protein
MAIPGKIRSIVGATLFLLGISVGLALSSGVVWGEIEARVYDINPADLSLKINCPLMLAPGEAGVVRALIVNSSSENVTPAISAEISHTGGPRQLFEILDLAPGETKSVQWQVGSEDIIFNRLILASVYQSQYRDLPAHIGYCGILQFNLFTLSGKQTFMLLFIFSLAAILFGAILWFLVHEPLDEAHSNFGRAASLIAVLCVMALCSAWLRWWGLALFLDGFSCLALGLMFIDFLLFPSKMAR